jgi:hypothetical protein
VLVEKVVVMKSLKNLLKQYLPIAPIASKRSASCTIANSIVGSTIDFFETSFLNPAVY